MALPNLSWIVVVLIVTGLFVATIQAKPYESYIINSIYANVLVSGGTLTAANMDSLLDEVIKNYDKMGTSDRGLLINILKTATDKGVIIEDGVQEKFVVVLREAFLAEVDDVITRPTIISTIGQIKIKATADFLSEILEDKSASKSSYSENIYNEALFAANDYLTVNVDDRLSTAISAVASTSIQPPILPPMPGDSFVMIPEYTPPPVPGVLHSGFIFNTVCDYVGGGVFVSVSSQQKLYSNLPQSDSPKLSFQDPTQPGPPTPGDPDFIMPFLPEYQPPIGGDFETTLPDISPPLQTLCPTVCVPMWELVNSECEYDGCGSGCGADGISTFETENECNTKSANLLIPDPNPPCTVVPNTQTYLYIDPNITAQTRIAVFSIETSTNLANDDANLEIKSLDTVPFFDAEGNSVYTDFNGYPLPMENRPLFKILQFLPSKYLDSSLKQAEITFTITDGDLKEKLLNPENLVAAVPINGVWKEFPLNYKKDPLSGMNEFKVAVPKLDILIITSALPDINEWKYKRKITLSEPLMWTSIIKLELPADFDYSKAKPDGSDLRFLNHVGDVLDYSLDEWNLAGKSVVSVKLPYTTGSGTSGLNYDIYMYYGNENAKPAHVDLKYAQRFYEYTQVAYFDASVFMASAGQKISGSGFGVWSVERGAWKVDESVLKNAGDSLNNPDAIFLDNILSKPGSSIRVKVKKGDLASRLTLITGFQDANNYYGLDIGQNGQMFIKEIFNGMQTGLTGKNLDFDKNKWYTVELRWIVGGEIEGRVWDDQWNSLDIVRIKLANSDRWSTGKFGLEALGKLGEVLFDDVYTGIEYGANIKVNFVSETPSLIPVSDVIQSIEEPITSQKLADLYLDVSRDYNYLTNSEKTSVLNFFSKISKDNTQKDRDVNYGISQFLDAMFSKESDQLVKRDIISTVGDIDLQSQNGPFPIPAYVTYTISQILFDAASGRNLYSRDIQSVALNLPQVKNNQELTNLIDFVNIIESSAESDIVVESVHVCENTYDDPCETDKQSGETGGRYFVEAKIKNVGHSARQIYTLTYVSELDRGKLLSRSSGSQQTIRLESEESRWVRLTGSGKRLFVPKGDSVSVKIELRDLDGYKAISDGTYELRKRIDLGVGESKRMIGYGIGLSGSSNNVIDGNKIIPLSIVNSSISLDNSGGNRLLSNFISAVGRGNGISITSPYGSTNSLSSNRVFTKGENSHAAYIDAPIDSTTSISGGVFHSDQGNDLMVKSGVIDLQNVTFRKNKMFFDQGELEVSWILGLSIKDANTGQELEDVDVDIIEKSKNNKIFSGKLRDAKKQEIKLKETKIVKRKLSDYKAKSVSGTIVGKRLSFDEPTSQSEELTNKYTIIVKSGGYVQQTFDLDVSETSPASLEIKLSKEGSQSPVTPPSTGGDSGGSSSSSGGSSGGSSSGGGYYAPALIDSGVSEKKPIIRLSRESITLNVVEGNEFIVNEKIKMKNTGSSTLKLSLSISGISQISVGQTLEIGAGMEKDVSLTGKLPAMKVGTYTGKLKIEGPDGLKKEVSIAVIVGPSQKLFDLIIDVESGKNAYFAGEDVVIKTKVINIEGTKFEAKIKYRLKDFSNNVVYEYEEIVGGNPTAELVKNIKTDSGLQQGKYMVDAILTENGEDVAVAAFTLFINSKEALKESVSVDLTPIVMILVVVIVIVIVVVKLVVLKH